MAAAVARVSRFRPDRDPLAEAPGPVLVLSSRAGLGNFSVGEAIAARAGARHRPIEDVIAPELCRTNFERHRLLCEHVPFVFHLTYRVGALYWMKQLRQQIRGTRRGDLDALRAEIVRSGARTVIVTNHRAALWVGALIRAGDVDCDLWAVLTDYHVGQGWRHVDWSVISRFFGPVDPEDVPDAAPRRVYRQIRMPVDPAYESLAATPGDPERTLVTGGGWGLGDIERVVATLLAGCPGLSIDVATGDNVALHASLLSRFGEHASVAVHGALPSLTPLMRRAGSVVTRPGGVTISEAHAAGRAIFLLPGLPVIEEHNARFSRKRFGARDFSVDAFNVWRRAHAPRTTQAS